MAEAEEEASPALDRDYDEASEAGSAVSGMSAYTTAFTTAGSTITSSGHSVSTVGGRKPQRKARQKVGHRVDTKTALISFAIPSVISACLEISEVGDRTSALDSLKLY